MTRKPRKNPLKEAGVHRDKMTMRAHQRAAFKHNALVASASESTPPRDEEAIRAQNREDIEAYRAHGLLDFERSAPPMFDTEWCPCQGLTSKCTLCGG